MGVGGCCGGVGGWERGLFVGGGRRKGRGNVVTEPGWAIQPGGESKHKRVNLAEIDLCIGKGREREKPRDPTLKTARRGEKARGRKISDRDHPPRRVGKLHGLIPSVDNG